MINQDIEQKMEKLDLERLKIDCAEKILIVTKSNDFLIPSESNDFVGSSNKLDSLIFEIFEQSLKNIKEL